MGLSLCPKIGLKLPKNSMNNKEKAALILLIEECAEVAQRATKCIRFGKHDIQEGQSFDNVERLVSEINDLQGVIRVLTEMGYFDKSRIPMGEMSKYRRSLAELDSIN